MARDIPLPTQEDGLMYQDFYQDPNTYVRSLATVVRGCGGPQLEEQSRRYLGLFGHCQGREPLGYRPPVFLLRRYNTFSNSTKLSHDAFLFGIPNVNLLCMGRPTGITSNRQSASDYDDDMKRARDAGIDAFALNIGTGSDTDTQLGFAYESAAKNGMQAFLSFDFNWWNIDQGNAIGAKVKQYADRPAQLMVDDKVFVSSFAGDGVDVNAMRIAAGHDIFFAPNFHPGEGDFDAVEGAMNWMAWPNNGHNRAPTEGENSTVGEGDESYLKALNGKPYIAPVSPWFSTHFGKDVPYSKNWVFPSDLLWYDRWRELLALGPRFVEIITWNDYGESHYVGPLSSPHTDDGASKWTMDMPHNGWLEMAKPFIAAYKAGVRVTIPYIQEEKLVYWYRPTKKNVNCDATDTAVQDNSDNIGGTLFTGRPIGYDSMADQVLVVVLLKSPARVAIHSGDQFATFDAPAGISAHRCPMGVGRQRFAVLRNGQEILSGTSLKDIGDTCVCGIYNFNAYVGSLPVPDRIDRLQPAGQTMLSQGLKMSCPTNTLGVTDGSSSTSIA